jgi:hypothetical protein
MNILDTPISEKGLKEIQYERKRGFGNVEEVWRHPDGVTIYRLHNSTEWHINTTFEYESIRFTPVVTFRELRDYHNQYLMERQRSLANWN